MVPSTSNMAHLYFLPKKNHLDYGVPGQGQPPARSRSVLGTHYGFAASAQTRSILGNINNLDISRSMWLPWDFLHNGQARP